MKHHFKTTPSFAKATAGKAKTPYHFAGNLSRAEITRYLRVLKYYLATSPVTWRQKNNIESEITFFENLKHLATKLKTEQPHPQPLSEGEGSKAGVTETSHIGSVPVGTLSPSPSERAGVRPKTETPRSQTKNRLNNNV